MEEHAGRGRDDGYNRGPGAGGGYDLQPGKYGRAGDAGAYLHRPRTPLVATIHVALAETAMSRPRSSTGRGGGEGSVATAAAAAAAAVVGMQAIADTN